MTERGDLINERSAVESDTADLQTELDLLAERVAQIDARIAVLDETEDDE